MIRNYFKVVVKLLSAAILLFSLSISAAGGPIDFQKPPPVTRTVFSPDGKYQLVIETLDKYAIARLELAQGQKKVLWKQDLPHEFGPRITFVGALGTSVLIDEWINVFTDNTITVIDNNGKTVVIHSINHIADILGMKRSELAANATFGPWMRGVPKLAYNGKNIIIPMGSTELFLSLENGMLFVNK